MHWMWRNDTDLEENKEPTMRSKLLFNVKPNSFKARPKQDCSGSWPPYSLVKDINKQDLSAPKFLVTFP